MTLQEFLNRYSYDPETDCIGEGGFGSVYKAYDNVLDREVAIKISAVRHIGGKDLFAQKRVRDRPKPASAPQYSLLRLGLQLSAPYGG